MFPNQSSEHNIFPKNFHKTSIKAKNHQPQNETIKKSTHTQ